MPMIIRVVKMLVALLMISEGELVTILPGFCEY